MQVIKHHDELVNINTCKPLGQVFPDLLYNLPCLTQEYEVADRFSERTLTEFGAYGNEVRPCLAVIVPRQTIGQPGSHRLTLWGKGESMDSACASVAWFEMPDDRLVV